MEQEIYLSEEERLAIEPILESMSGTAKHSISFDSLLRKWMVFVIEVEQEYEFTIYDYMNELSVRDLIERIFEAAPESLQIKLDAVVQEWDHKFKQATKTIGYPLRAGSLLKAWWWYRIPNIPGEELRNDLEAEGLG